MPVLEPFQGAAEESESQKRGLLDAIAQAGAAGKAAYLDAQAQVDRTRTAALDRARQRAQITGQDFGGADTSAVTETADRFGSYFAGQNAASQSQLGQIGASGESYLAKVGAIAPFMQQQNLSQAADREQGFKMDVAANQMKIDSAKAKEEADRAHEIQMFNMRDKANQRDTIAKAAAVKPAAVRGPSVAQERKDAVNVLMGEGAQLAGNYNSILGRGNPKANQSFKDFSVLESARALAAYKGLDDDTINAYLTPQAAAAYEKLAKAPQSEKDTYAASLSKKYASKGVTPSLANSVVNNSDFQAATAWILSGPMNENGQPLSREELEDTIRREFITQDGRNWMAEYVVLTGEYLPRFKTNKQLGRA